MITEIKLISVGIPYNFIELDKYTNKKDSITVIFKDTGKIFTDWELTDYGSLKIKHNSINYNKYDNCYSIKMIIKYESCELPINLYDINTEVGLSNNITDIKSLNYISCMRLVANRKFNITLDEFVLFNSIISDQFGQNMKLVYDNQLQYDYKFKDKIITLKNFNTVIQRYSATSGVMPSRNDICPNCNQRWNLNNLRDVIKQEEFMYHEDCNKFVLYEKTKKQFDYICSKVFENYSIHAIKNEYGSANYNGSWFIIKTENGDIKIGWRKRVILIEWLDSYKIFSFNGKDEDVTKYFSGKQRYIHAWSVEKAIEYLLKADNS
jgi:hypothetical protein